MPLINYAVNYEYIVKNLCENKDITDSSCKGKCFVQKELAKTEKQSNNFQNIKIVGIDVFISGDILSFSAINSEFLNEKVDADHSVLYKSQSFSKIFHPPLIEFI